MAGSMVRDYGTVEARGPSGWTYAEGILLILIGLVAIGAPLVTAGITAIMLPIVLLVKGIVEIVTAIRGHSVGRAIWSVLLGIITILAALAIFAAPVIAFVSLPILLGVYLLVDGILRIVASVAAPPESGRGWIAVGGIISLILAGLVFTASFGQALAIVGLYVGLNVLFAGILLIVLAMSERRHASHGGLSPV